MSNILNRFYKSSLPVIFIQTAIATSPFAIRICSRSTAIMSVLNVAEKNDAAKHIAGYLSGGNSQRREGFSKYNKIYQFECQLRGRNRKMIMTSVSGHLLNHEFFGSYKKWNSCDPADLFDAPVQKFCPADYEPIKRTLEREVRGCDTLVIWTDCDREGENIGFEIINVCTTVKPNIQIFRAKFSEITARSVRRALETLSQPNELVSKAVDVRSELDLRIGAAFTRFQTLRLQRVFPQQLSNNVISYGSCQFPTLGFVVERYKAIERFIPEPFWKIKVSHDVDDVKVDYTWTRVKLFDELACRVLYERCLEQPTATVESIVSKPKSKWRPLPLDTVEFEKLASRKLRMNAKTAMTTAEKLYSQGYISYPRTETNIFPKELNLVPLVEQQADNRQWGEFARRVLEEGPNPRQGKKSDQAHPPIHPTKAATNLQGLDAKVYEFVVRHFLACVSKDAQGHETIVTINIHGEKFVASGLMILARNYLDVYPYENWGEKEIHIYSQGQQFEPTTLEMVDGETSAPKLLTEADLIGLMEKHGIGTDATHAEHIDKIKTRAYVGLQDEIYFVPGHLGIGLVDGYDDMGFNMSKPYLRAELEADLVRISNGEKDSQVVLQEQIAKYREVFRLTSVQAEKIDAALAGYLQAQPAPVANMTTDRPTMIRRCPGCRQPISAKQRANGEWFLGCDGYPDCRNSRWLPSIVLEVEVTGSTCSTCGPDVKELKLCLQPGALAPHYPDTVFGCLNGCDQRLLDFLGIQSLASAPSGGHNQSTVSSGYSSLNSNNNNNTGNTARPSLHTRTQFRNSFEEHHTDDRDSPSTNFNNTDPDEVYCTCGLPARRLKVLKESVNKGRFFYTCSKSVDERCSFFQWADEGEGQVNGRGWGGGDGGGGGGGDRGGGRGGRGGGRGRGVNKSSSSQFRAKPYESNAAPRQGGKRQVGGGTRQKLCGNCREPGHTRPNCPLGSR